MYEAVRVRVCLYHAQSRTVYMYIASLLVLSQGGLVAQALFGVKDFNHSWVTTIITLASPLRRPVISFDHSLQQFYDDIGEVSCTCSS